MKTACNRLSILLTAMLLFTMTTLWSSQAASSGPKSAAGTGPTPLEEALSKWRQGDKEGAVDRFLRIDWKAGPALSPKSPLATLEKDLPKMSAPAREKLMGEVMASLKDLKQLGSAVKEKSDATSKANPTLARTCTAQLDGCATALNMPEGLKIVQLTAEALHKIASGEARKN